MFKVANKACENCLFSKDAIVSASRIRNVLKECRRDDTHFICHKASMVGEDICCRAFYDTQTSNLMRIAGRLGAIEFVDLPVGPGLIPARTWNMEWEGDKDGK